MNEIPRCRHGKILGSCDFDTCPEEREWWQSQWAALEIHLAGMAAALPEPPTGPETGDKK